MAIPDIEPETNLISAIAMTTYDAVASQRRCTCRGNTFVLQANHRVLMGDQGLVIEPIMSIGSDGSMVLLK